MSYQLYECSTRKVFTEKHFNIQKKAYWVFKKCVETNNERQQAKHVKWVELLTLFKDGYHKKFERMVLKLINEANV